MGDERRDLHPTGGLGARSDVSAAWAARMRRAGRTPAGGDETIAGPWPGAHPARAPASSEVSAGAAGLGTPYPHLARSGPQWGRALSVSPLAPVLRSSGMNPVGPSDAQGPGRSRRPGCPRTPSPAAAVCWRQAAADDRPPDPTAARRRTTATAEATGIGVIPPYSMPVRPPPGSIGWNEAFRTSGADAYEVMTSALVSGGDHTRRSA